MCRKGKARTGLFAPRLLHMSALCRAVGAPELLCFGGIKKGGLGK